MQLLKKVLKKIKIGKASATKKMRNQKREKESEEGSELYGTLKNDPDSPSSEKMEAKKNNGQITKIEEKLLKTKYSEKGPALFGSVNNLLKARNLSKKKVKPLPQTEPARTKHGIVILKNAAIQGHNLGYRDIWSLDLGYVDKVINYNHEVTYLLVAVDCMSRYLKVQPLKSKSATKTAEAFKLMITKKRPKKVWVDKCLGFKGSFKAFSKKERIKNIRHKIEKKSALAERKIRSLKNLNDKNLDYKCTS